jgi:hypothetical protein
MKRVAAEGTRHLEGKTEGKAEGRNGRKEEGWKEGFGN